MKIYQATHIYHGGFLDKGSSRVVVKKWKLLGLGSILGSVQSLSHGGFTSKAILYHIHSYWGFEYS